MATWEECNQPIEPIVPPAEPSGSCCDNIEGGSNVTIERDGERIIINASGGGTEYTAGENIDITGDVISAPNVYSKTATDALLDDYATQEDIGALEEQIGEKADSSAVYTKTEVDDAIDLLATKSELSAVEAAKQDVLTAGSHINITSNVVSADLSNYYNKTEVDDLIDDIAVGEYRVVQTLPATGEHLVIYLVPTGQTTGDLYDEYIWVNNQWERIGGTNVDLSQYYTKTEADNLLNAKQDTLTAGQNVQISNDVISATDTTYSQATDNDLGLVKLNTAEGVDVNANGQLDIKGIWGVMPSTGGAFFPKDRDPRAVGANSLLVTDALGMDMSASRSLAVVSGIGLAGLAGKPYAAGTTEYKMNNTYANRILCAGLKYLSLSEESSTVERIVPIQSITIGGQPFTPDSQDGTDPIVITVTTSLNPDSEISPTSLRGFRAMEGYASAYIGSGIGADTGGASLFLGQSVFNKSGNGNVVVGNTIYNQGNGNAVFGRNHISKKNRWFMVGTGHDNTNGSSEAGAVVGQYALIDANTLFAVGNGTSATVRKNAFEVTSDGGIVLMSPDNTRWKISVDNNGNLTTTAL